MGGAPFAAAHTRRELAVRGERAVPPSDDSLDAPQHERAGLPVAMTIGRVIEENDQTKTFILSASLRADPGQFAMLWLPGLDEKPFSFMADDPVAFTIAAVGPFSRALHRLTAGDKVWVRGPLGRGFRPTPEAGSAHLLVGGGYGVSPLVFLARRMRGTGARVGAVVGARTSKEVLLTKELGLAGARVTVTTEDGSLGEKGMVTDVVQPVLRDEPPAMLYACGPHGMLRALTALCGRFDIPAQMSWEAYMRCGIGLCGSCEHQGKLVCADGPVLEYEPPGLSPQSEDLSSTA